MSDTITPGTILWVRLAPRGNNKLRPAVALSSLGDDDIIYVVVGSTKEPDGIETAFELPWHPAGHCRTRLRKKTILDLGWRESVKRVDVFGVGGVVPGAVLADIEDRIATLAAIS